MNRHNTLLINNRWKTEKGHPGVNPQDDPSTAIRGAEGAVIFLGWNGGGDITESRQPYTICRILLWVPES